MQESDSPGQRNRGCSGRNGVYRAGVVERTKVDGIILDTRAARPIIHSRLMPSRKVTNHKRVYFVPEPI